MVLTAVFLLSLSSLAFEVLLARLFSISQWNHLSFMVISLALFGFAASGTFLSLVESRQHRWYRHLTGTVPIKGLLRCYTACTIASFLLVTYLPLDYFRIPLEFNQILYLLAAYLTLSLPFFFTGLTVCSAYAYLPKKTGPIYAATMTGAALGAVLPIPLLAALGLELSTITVSMIPLILLPFCESSRIKKTILGLFVIAAAFIGMGLASKTTVLPSPYKSLSQMLRFPKTKITETAASLRGRMDEVKSPYIRFVPGLSLKFPGQPPLQHAILKDGDAPLYLYDIQKASDLDFARWMLSYSGYALNPKPAAVLLLLNGGGTSIPCALAADPGRLVIVDRHPYTAEKIRARYGLPVVQATHRAFISNTRDAFSIIHVEDWGSSLPGTAALNQSYLYTKDAFRQYFKHLDPGGMILMSRRLLLPPSDTLRLWASALEALYGLGIESPARHLVILRNWDTFTLLVSKSPIRKTQQIRQHAKSFNFDVVYLADLKRSEANQYNVFDQPFHYDEISRLKASYERNQQNAFWRSHILDVSAQTDNRPFPNRFLKWTKIRHQYNSMGSRFYSLFLSGEVIVGVVFIVALIISLLLLIAPVLLTSKRGDRLNASALLFFLGVGFGFMFIELYFIKSYILLFGDPIISLCVVLSAILVYSGAGGYWSHSIGFKRLGPTVLFLVALSILSWFAMPWLMHQLLQLTALFQYGFAFLLLLPFGFLMGVPFPLGMQYLVSSPAQRSYGWAVNGCASVMTSILSVQIALSFGISYILIGAVAAYGLVYLSMGAKRKGS